MNVVLELTQRFLPWLLQASCQASVVVLIVLATQWIFRRHLPPRWSHALWLLVLIRCNSLAPSPGASQHRRIARWLEVTSGLR